MNAKPFFYQETHGIRISVRPLYLEEQSQPILHRYVFAYFIRIENVSQRTVQRFTLGVQSIRIDEHRHHDARAQQHARHNDRGRRQQLARIANSPHRALRIVAMVAAGGWRSDRMESAFSPAS